MKRREIAVFGGARTAEGSPGYETAVRLGELLAGAGYTVRNGGYGGAMAAVSRGAKLAGGHVIGITMSAFRSVPNPYLDEARAAPDLYERLRHLIRGADGMIVLPGGLGTLVELFLAWNLVKSRQNPEVPLILLGQSWWALLSAVVATTQVNQADMACLEVAAGPERALEILLRRK